MSLVDEKCHKDGKGGCEAKDDKCHKDHKGGCKSEEDIAAMSSHSIESTISSESNIANNSIVLVDSPMNPNSATIPPDYNRSYLVNENLIRSILQSTPRRGPEDCSCPYKRETSLALPSEELHPLAYRPMTPQDKLGLEKSQQCKLQIVPCASLPDWHFLPLTRKIPFIRQLQALMGPPSRGKLCSPDPELQHSFNSEIPYSLKPLESNPLRDPSLKTYFNQPSVKKQLLSSGLINERDEVICSLKEINDYRQWIWYLIRDDIQKQMDSQQRDRKAEVMQLRKIQRQIKLEAQELSDLRSHLKSHGADDDDSIDEEDALVIASESSGVLKDIEFISRAERVRQTRIEMEEDFHLQAEISRRYKQSRYEAVVRKRDEERFEKILRNEQRSSQIAERNQILDMKSRGSQTKLLASLIFKEIQSKQYLQLKKMTDEESKMQSAGQRLMVRNLRGEQKHLLRRKIEEATKIQQAEDRQERQKLYNRRLKAHAQAKLRRLKAKERELRLCRKYFNIWRKKVKELRILRADTDHQTTFSGRDMQNSLHNWSKEFKKVCKTSLNVKCGNECY